MEPHHTDIRVERLANTTELASGDVAHAHQLSLVVHDHAVLCPARNVPNRAAVECIESLWLAEAEVCLGAELMRRIVTEDRN